MLSELYILRRSSLLRLLTRMVHNPQTAEDLVQEAYLRVARAMEAGTVSHPDAFLRRTAQNLAVDHQRHRRRQSRLAPEDAGPADPAEVECAAPSVETRMIERERIAALSGVLAQLSPRVRRVWHLCYVEEMTYAQVAAQLGISRNTVYNDMKLALGQCHDAMKRFEGR
ncbi:MAG: RNA polymerase sigma factor [Paracoccaceae bacterium]